MLLIGVITTTTVSAQGEYVASHYGTSYEGRTMGCGGIYYGNDTSVLAVGPSLYWVRCGTPYTITGPAGSIQVTRQDSCPGCDRYNMLDLSESGITAVCGGLHTCKITLTPGHTSNINVNGYVY